MSYDRYDPNSWNAQLASIKSAIEFAERQSGIYRTEMREVTGEIRESVKELVELLSLQNGRVKKLETWRSEQRAKVAVIGMIAGGLVSFLGWLIPMLLKK